MGSLPDTIIQIMIYHCIQWYIYITSTIIYHNIPWHSIIWFTTAIFEYTMVRLFHKYYNVRTIGRDMWYTRVQLSLMAEWLEQASQWHEMYYHYLEVMSSNLSRVERGVRSTSVLSRTWTNPIIVPWYTHGIPPGVYHSVVGLLFHKGVVYSQVRDSSRLRYECHQIFSKIFCWWLFTTSFIKIR